MSLSGRDPTAWPSSFEPGSCKQCEYATEQLLCTYFRLTIRTYTHSLVELGDWGIGRLVSGFGSVLFRGEFE